MATGTTPVILRAADDELTALRQELATIQGLMQHSNHHYLRQRPGASAARRRQHLFMQRFRTLQAECARLQQRCRAMRARLQSPSLAHSLLMGADPYHKGDHGDP